MALSGRDKEMEAAAMQREGQRNRDVSFVGLEAYDLVGSSGKQEY